MRGTPHTTHTCHHHTTIISTIVGGEEKHRTNAELISKAIINGVLDAESEELDGLKELKNYCIPDRVTKSHDSPGVPSVRARARTHTYPACALMNAERHLPT